MNRKLLNTFYSFQTDKKLKIIEVEYLMYKIISSIKTQFSVK